MNAVVEWLESPAGRKWAQGHFSLHSSDCHDMIEVIDDLCGDVILGHAWPSSEGMLAMCKAADPIWADLTWTPDEPPERVL